MSQLVNNNEEECKFLQVLKIILSQPDFRSNRTGVRTKSIFCPPELRFSLRDNQFPLLTTRKLSLRLIFEELMWMIRGQTDVSILQSKRVNVWNANSTREFLDHNGKSHIAEGHIGKSYGYQFRKYGGYYDQLSNAIHLIRNDPTNRRIIINLWNPCDLDDMALPPCLYCYQFYVSNGMLSCKATQRSSDITLAGGWNIATISLLTILIAHVCDLVPNEIIWSVGDAHIYENQIESATQQCEQIPNSFPTLHITRSVKDITHFEFDYLELRDYHPQKSISVAMNA